MNVTVFENNGSLLSVIFNAITLCLIYNGIEMIDFPVALNFNENVDLCLKEEYRCNNCFIVYKIHSDEVLYVESSGQTQTGVFNKNLQNAKKTCHLLFGKFKMLLDNLQPLVDNKSL